MAKRNKAFMTPQEDRAYIKQDLARTLVSAKCFFILPRPTAINFKKFNATLHEIASYYMHNDLICFNWREPKNQQLITTVCYDGNK